MKQRSNNPQARTSKQQLLRVARVAVVVARWVCLRLGRFEGWLDSQDKKPVAKTALSDGPAPTPVA